MNKLGSLLSVVNLIAVSAVLGLFVYTKILYKRPVITEGKERLKLVQPSVKGKVRNKVVINFDPITANLNPFVDEQGKQKTHYVSLAMALELRDELDQTKFNEAKPVILDRALQILVKKKFEDLNQVQGRYLLRSQMIDAANEYLGAPIVTEIYFSDFLLQ